MKRPLHLIGGVVAFAVATSFAAPGSASLVLAVDLPELVARSERVVVAEVLSVRSSWTPDKLRIYSTIEVSVAETWKGATPASRRVVIEQPGGSVDDIEMRVHGMPAFRVGERAVLFLTGTPSSVVGLAQGRKLLRFESSSRRWMVEGGDRSAAVVRDAAGNLVPAPRETPLPLDELRRRVRSLIDRR